ncbi:SPW repeat protein [Alicycliphilus denitrificans]|uniref:SPW repeat protein n=3 Tax=Alicycliphilus denitrificans TaxID=179636 RepID=F4GAP4_ALIDK|nr:SPW repeat-containing protein [Alicycliphilus denitrificans BC]AEB85757.1 SPW repeat protein [Alicycliphilus denitrificans K601]QKD43530.1 SPW repeat protein [Alicycliphilus denitrificans]
MRNMKSMKHWQDPLNALLGVWLALSPWVMGFESQMVPTASSVVAGLALIAVSLGAVFVPRAWEEWTQAALGVWMIASPWVLGFSGQMDVMRVAVASGIVVLALALWVLATDKDYSTWMHHGAAH